MSKAIQPRILKPGGSKGRILELLGNLLVSVLCRFKAILVFTCIPMEILMEKKRRFKAFRMNLENKVMSNQAKKANTSR